MANNSFVFVKPSGDGTADKCYAGEDGTYAYRQTGWEWILERALRRALILSVFQEPVARLALATRSGMYRFCRWPAYRVNWGSTSFPPSYAWNGPAREHDGSLDFGHVEMLLPTGGSTTVSHVRRISTDVESRLVYGVADTIQLVEALAGDRGLSYNASFLAPDWAPPANYRTTASVSYTYRETRDGNTGHVSGSSKFSSRTPYAVPEAGAFFRLLGDWRVDDEPETVAVTDSEGHARSVTLPTTLAPVDMDDDMATLDGVKVRRRGYVGVNQDRILAFESKSDMPGSGDDMTDDEAIAQVGARPEHVAGARGSCIYTSMSGKSGWFLPDISWGNDGRPTWWHAAGYPRGLYLVQSGKLREQLQALSVTQPATPPRIPALSSMPEDGTDRSTWPVVHQFGTTWPSNCLALAATPYCASRMLDAMKTTVHRVDYLFADVEGSEELTDRDDTTSTTTTTPTAGAQDGTTTSWTQTESSSTTAGSAVLGGGSGLGLVRANVLAYYAGGIHDEIWGDSVNDSETSTSDYTSTSIYEEDGATKTSASNTRSQTSRSYSYRRTLALKSPRPLVSTDHTQPTVGTETTSETTSDRGTVDPERTTGSVGIPTDPGGADLMFPEWILPWIKKAELFMAYESKLFDNEPGELADGLTYVNDHGSGASATYRGGGERTGTVQSAKGVVSLGEMNLATGAFPDIDVVALRASVGPSAGGRMYDPADIDTVTGETSDTTGAHQVVTTVTDTTTTYKSGAYRKLSSALYVVVEWDFDREGDVPPFGRRLREQDEFAAAADALFRAQGGKQRAGEAKSDAQSEVAARERGLEAARAALEAAEDAPPREELERAVEDAEAALEAAEAALEAAEDAYGDAVSECEDAQEAKDSAEQALADAYAGADESAFR